ncbi:hypothetical protein JL722_6675 [Aureococcus anophagefferens]|nr:hypothetical protein JL722_6675 [Aureococcus anophagefferens]
MLSHSDVLDAIDLKVDYLGSAASIEEHGIILESVNKYELCAEDSLEQGEWWPMVHCMYGLQACMSYTETSDAMSCSEAESGAGDDVAIPGSDTTGLDSCVCTLEGVVDYCSAKHTSTNLTTLSACTKSAEALTLYEESNNVAYAINDGSPLWVTINGNEYSFSTNETDIGLASWATQVLSLTCQAIDDSGASLPSTCSDYVYPSSTDSSDVDNTGGDVTPVVPV